MKSLVKTFLRTLAVLAACAAPFARAAVTPDQLAPDFAFTDLAGKTRKLSDFRGKTVVLEWLNPACPYVVRHYRSGNLPAIQKLAAAEGVVWLQINSMAMGDLDAEKSRDWQQKQGVVATAYIRDVSGKIGRLYGAKTTPHCFVISRDGKLVYQGAIDDQPQGSVASLDSAHNYVKAALAALQAGRPLEKSVTQPYGCEIKYGDGG